MNRIPHLNFLAALVLLGAATACAAAERGTVEYSERAQPTISKRGDWSSLRVRLFANGHDYRLRLELNPRLERWSTGPWHQYAGFVEGNGKSWVRLAIADTALRGVIFDGEELIAVEPADKGQVTVYRVPDLHFATPLSFDGGTASGAMHKQESVVAPLSAPTEAETPGRKLEISAMGDAAFLSRYDSVDEARDAMLTRLNIVDGIFSAQVGVTIEVTSVDIADDLSNSLDASTDPSMLLDSLGRLRQQTPSLSSRGLTHLFTGRNLDGDNVGIGYQATLCRARFSASLAQAHGNATLDGLITAHEIGHVFGAPHDGAGQCASVPQGQYIMSPVLDTQATSFSQCSLDQMAPLVASASCLAPLSPPDLSLPESLGTHDVVAGVNFDWVFTLANQGDSAASDVRVTIQLTAGLDIASAAIEGGRCVVQSALVTCDLASLGAGESAEVSVTVRGKAAGTFSAHAQVTAADDTNRANDEADGTLRVQAAGSPPPTTEPQQPARSGGGALDVGLLEFLAALLALVAHRRLSLRAATR